MWFRSFLSILTFLFVLPATLDAQVLISNMDDIDLGKWPGFGDLVATDRICVFKDNRGVRYRITMRGPGPSGEFELLGQSANLSFVAEFAGSNGVFREMIPGVSRNFNRADRNSQTCNGDTNAEIRITITEASLSSVEGASYSGDLVVLLEP